MVQHIGSEPGCWQVEMEGEGREETAFITTFISSGPCHTGSEMPLPPFTSSWRRSWLTWRENVAPLTSECVVTKTHPSQPLLKYEKKCNFYKWQLKFQGHISERGVHINPKKTQTEAEYVPPQNVKALQHSWVSLAGTTSLFVILLT